MTAPKYTIWQNSDEELYRRKKSELIADGYTKVGGIPYTPGEFCVINPVRQGPRKWLFELWWVNDGDRFRVKNK